MCDVEALIASARGWISGLSADTATGREFIADLCDVLEGLVSAPTGDERETLHNAIRETVIRWEDCGGNIEHMLKESLSGFRLPVVPVPVYEYGVRYGDGTYARFAGTRAEAENKLCVNFGDRVVYRVAQIPAVPASEWEPVEATRKEQP